MYHIEGDDAELMVIVVGGNGIELHGAGGHSNATITIEQARTLLADAEQENYDAELLVVWPSNADGNVQVETRSIDEVWRELYSADTTE